MVGIFLSPVLRTTTYSVGDKWYYCAKISHKSMPQTKFNWLSQSSKNLKEIKISKDIKYVLLAWPMLWVAQIALLVVFWNKLPQKVPLYYSRPWGEDQLADKVDLFLLPIISLAIFLINAILSRIIVQKDELLKNTLLIATDVVAILCLICLYQIIRLVI
jgi:hypothetical protein